MDLAQELINDLTENDGPYLHPPGHPEAVQAGCICPTSDNGHGKGSGQYKDGLPLYWINYDCPYHVEQEN